jgi:hypothetical protein
MRQAALAGSSCAAGAEGAGSGRWSESLIGAAAVLAVDGESPTLFFF